MKRANELNPSEWPEYIQGLAGIADLFQISTKTAAKWKNDWLAPAITQRGRFIMLNTAKAIELFSAQN